MEYTKPDVTLLGKAIAAIHGMGKITYAPADNTTSMRFTVPAYEADE